MTDTGQDLDPAAGLVRIAVFAADFEAMKPRPASKVPDPNGLVQGETAAEFTRRIIEAGVMHLIEQGLLVIPGDITARLNGPILLQRA